MKTPKGRGGIFAVVRSTEKYCESLLRCMQQKYQWRHQRDYCIQLHCSRLASVTLTIPREKFREKFAHLRCNLSSKFFDSMIYYNVFKRTGVISTSRRESGSWRVCSRKDDKSHDTPYSAPVRQRIDNLKPVDHVRQIHRRANSIDHLLPPLKQAARQYDGRTVQSILILQWHLL